METQEPKMDNIKIYSRKQIINWVSSFSYPSAKYEQLNNGAFFCYLLKDIFPQQFSKTKINQRPVGQFQCANNLNLMKKVLNKHKYQMNLNVHAVSSSKNCFELANWFRNLAERCNIIDLSVINDRQSLNNTKTSFIMSQVLNNRESSAKKSQRSKSSMKNQKSISVTQRKQFNNKLLPTERGYYNKNAVNNSQLINLNKQTTFENIKIKKKNNFKTMSDAKSVQSAQQNQTNQIIPKNRIQQDELMQTIQIDPFQMLQEQAIIQNIQQFKKVIFRIKQYTENYPQGKQNSYEDFKAKVLSCIYKRP